MAGNIDFLALKDYVFVTGHLFEGIGHLGHLFPGDVGTRATLGLMAQTAQSLMAPLAMTANRTIEADMLCSGAVAPPMALVPMAVVTCRLRLFCPLRGPLAIVSLGPTVHGRRFGNFGVLKFVLEEGGTAMVAVSTAGPGYPAALGSRRDIFNSFPGH